jgi:hypothetical protein
LTDEAVAKRLFEEIEELEEASGEALRGTARSKRVHQ